MRNISIHALRVEGDVYTCPLLMCNHTISIHALRVEGDKTTSHLSIRQRISIHALRVEGDTCDVRTLELALLDFYPRPPGGGRQKIYTVTPVRAQFLSTPSGWRATKNLYGYSRESSISIHALRVEGDPIRRRRSAGHLVNFYPRPPGGGRPTI